MPVYSYKLMVFIPVYILQTDVVYTSVQFTNWRCLNQVYSLQTDVFIPVYNLPTKGVYSSVQFTHWCCLCQCTFYKLMLFILVYSLQTDVVYTSVLFTNWCCFCQWARWRDVKGKADEGSSEAGQAQRWAQRQQESTELVQHSVYRGSSHRWNVAARKTVWFAYIVPPSTVIGRVKILTSPVWKLLATLPTSTRGGSRVETSVFISLVHGHPFHIAHSSSHKYLLKETVWWDK